MNEIDTTNDHLVGMRGDQVVIVLPPMAPMGHDEALRLAAWLVAVADPLGDDFDTVRKAVLST